MRRAQPKNLIFFRLANGKKGDIKNSVNMDFVLSANLLLNLQRAVNSFSLKEKIIRKMV